MKRARLARKTPLRPTGGLSRGAGLARRSKKRAALYREERIPFVKRLLAEKPECEIRVEGVCTGKSVDLHEPLMRSRGGSITDPDNAVATCRLCHDHLHANPAWATANGWLRSRYSV